MSMPPSERALNKLSIKPTYNVSQGTINEFLPFNCPLASTTMTLSSCVIGMPSDTLDSVTAYKTSSGFPQLIQKQDTVGFYTAGDDTDFERVIFIKNNVAFEVTQCFLQFAVGTVLSAYTSNGVTFDSVEVEVRAYDGNNKTNYTVAAKKKFETGFSQQTGTDAGDIYICQLQFSGASVKSSDTIGVYIKCNNTKVATCTYQSGLLPLFAFTVTDYTKPFFVSGMVTHMLPSFNAAAAAFKHELTNYPVDTFGAPITNA